MSQGLETGRREIRIGWERCPLEQMQTITAHSRTCWNLWAPWAELNPTLKSCFQAQPVPFAGNTHFSLLPLTLTSGSPRHLRGLPKPHGAICPADDLPAGAVHELGQPANAPHKETRIDIEENDSGVAIRIPPVSHKCGLEERSEGPFYEVRVILLPQTPWSEHRAPPFQTLPWGPDPVTASPLPSAPAAQPVNNPLPSHFMGCAF